MDIPGIERPGSADDPGRDRRWFGGPLVGPRREDWVSRRAGCGSSRCSRRACRWSGGTGPGPPCRRTSRWPRTSRAGRGRGSRRHRRRRRRTAAGGVAAAGAVAAVRAAATLGVAGGLAAGPTRRAAARLGEATLRVEVLLGCGEHEFLSAVRTGQVLVVVHENETPLGSRRDPVGFLASAVRGVRVCVELRSGHGPFRGVYERDGTRSSARLHSPDFRRYRASAAANGATAKRWQNCLHQMIALREVGRVGAGGQVVAERAVGRLEPPELEGVVGVAVGVRREVDEQVRAVADREVVEAQVVAAGRGLDDRRGPAAEVEVVGAAGTRRSRRSRPRTGSARGSEAPSASRVGASDGAGSRDGDADDGGAARSAATPRPVRPRRAPCGSRSARPGTSRPAAPRPGRPRRRRRSAPGGAARPRTSRAARRRRATTTATRSTRSRPGCGTRTGARTTSLQVADRCHGAMMAADAMTADDGVSRVIGAAATPARQPPRASTATARPRTRVAPSRGRRRPRAPARVAPAELARRGSPRRAARRPRRGRAAPGRAGSGATGRRRATGPARGGRPTRPRPRGTGGPATSGRSRSSSRAERDDARRLRPVAGDQPCRGLRSDGARRPGSVDELGRRSGPARRDRPRRRAGARRSSLGARFASVAPERRHRSTSRAMTR